MTGVRKTVVIRTAGTDHLELTVFGPLWSAIPEGFFALPVSGAGNVEDGRTRELPRKGGHPAGHPGKRPVGRPTATWGHSMAGAGP